MPNDNIARRAAGFSLRGFALRAADGTSPPSAEPARISDPGRHSRSMRCGTRKRDLL